MTALERPTDMTAERYEATRILAPRIRGIATRLSTQADRADRLADRIDYVPAPTWNGDTPYSDEVAGLIRDLVNELANLSLGGIITSAAAVDVYRSRGE